MLAIHDPAPTRLPDAWVEHLQRFEWSHIGVLTTKHVELSQDGFKRKFLDVYVRVLTRRAQRPLHWFAVIEGDPYQDRRTHLHFSIGGTSALTVKQMEGA